MLRHIGLLAKGSRLPALVQHQYGCIQEATSHTLSEDYAATRLNSHIPDHTLPCRRVHTAPTAHASGLGGTGSSTVDIFDRDVKRAHRERAALLQTSEDPLQAEVAERLLDRLEDCKRTFPRVAVLGGAAGAVVSRLSGGRAGIESAILLDSSSAMLERCRQQVSQQQASTAQEASTSLEVHYIEGEEEMLPLKERSMDLIVSCLALHWVNDLPVRPEFNAAHSKC